MIHCKKGYFFPIISWKGVTFYMLELTCVSIFPIRVTTRGAAMSRVCVTIKNTEYKSTLFTFNNLLGISKSDILSTFLSNEVSWIHYNILGTVYNWLHDREFWRGGEYFHQNH